MVENCTKEKKDKAQTVLDAATEIFLSHGFSAATTDMIQKKAGVSKATMYGCYANKEAIFAAVIERECQAMISVVKDVAPTPDDIAQTLTAIGTSYLTIILSETGIALFRVAVGDAPRFPSLARAFYLSGPKAMTNVLADHLAEAAKDGQLNLQTVGIDHAAGLFISLLRGELQMDTLTHPGATPSAAQIDYHVGLAVTTFMAAFGVK